MLIICTIIALEVTRNEQIRPPFVSQSFLQVLVAPLQNEKSRQSVLQGEAWRLY